MSVWYSECVWDIIWLQDTIGFQVICKKNGGKTLLDDMGIWDRKCVWDIIWLQHTKGFQDIYRKADGK